MKKISVAVLCLILAVMVATAFAASGVQQGNQNVTLYSAVTGTTAATNSSIFTFDYPMTSIQCDLVVSPTFTSTMKIDSNITGTNVFDANNVLISTVTLTTGQIRSGYASSRPFRTIRATTSAGTTTQLIQVNCAGMQQ